MRHTRPVSLFRLFAQPFLHLLAQVVDVVLCHQDLDAVQELLARAGGFGDDSVLFDEMNRQVEFVDRDPVTDVAVQAVGLLDEDCAAGRVRSQERKHQTKGRPPGLFGGFDVDEFLKDYKSFAGRSTRRMLLPFGSTKIPGLRPGSTIRDYLGDTVCARRAGTLRMFPV